VCDSANLNRLKQRARRLRNRRRAHARRLLDEAYAEYRSGLTSHNNNNRSSSISNNFNEIVTAPPLPPSQSPSSDQPPSPPSSPTPPVVEPDSPHSVLTQRILPDSPPPSIRSFSPPSYSPVSSPEEPLRPVSPTNSTTSSVEFIEEIHIPPPHPQYYYNYDPHQPLDTLLQQFPQRATPLPPDSYSIGPDDFDLTEIRHVISNQDPDTIIPVFLPNSPFPYEVPIRFFYNLFPPSTAFINELYD